jgi:hypothetical protein
MLASAVGHLHIEPTTLRVGVKPFVFERFESESGQLGHVVPPLYSQAYIKIRATMVAVKGQSETTYPQKRAQLSQKLTQSQRV